MKKTLNFIFMSVLILTFALRLDGSEAQVNTTSVESIEWQKIKLQDDIRKRYESVISKIITSSKFIVNVNVDINSPDKIKAPKSTNEFKDVKQIKFNNSPSTDSKGDAIIFSKLGLEAPVIQDEDNYKRESLKKTIKEISSNFNVFNFLKAVNIEILLNEKLDVKTRKVVEDLILGTKAIANEKVKPRVTIKYISMEETFIDEKVKEPSLFEKIIKIAPQYANAIGLILSVLIFGTIAFILFKKYFDLQEKQMELLKSQVSKHENKNNNDDLNKDEKKSQSLHEGEFITDEESVSAFERFRNLLKNSPVESKLLIKKWIKAEDDLSKLALNALVKQLNNDELKDIFDALTLNERKAWKAKLKIDITDHEIKLGNSFISSQTINDIIAPPMVKDPELLKIISGLTPKQGADIAKFNIESGSILMNIMPPKFLADMMEHLPEDSIESIIHLSAKASEEEITAKLENFKDQLPPIQAVLNRSPFMENILSHIAFASPNTERSLFKLMAAFEPLEVVIQTAISNLPVEVIKQAPNKIIQASLQSFPQSQRIQYFYVQDEPLRAKLLDLFTPEGSKARELVMFEFEKIDSDQSLQEEVIKSKLNLEKAYFQSIRKIVRNNPDIAKDIKPIVSQWVQDLDAPIEKMDHTEDELKNEVA